MKIEHGWPMILPICFSSMPYPGNTNLFCLIINLINDPVLPHSNSVEMSVSMELTGADQVRIPTKCFHNTTNPSFHVY